MKGLIKNVLMTLVCIIVAIVIIGEVVSLIDGRSPQAIVISKLFDQATMDTYNEERGDTTDKTTVEIPDRVKFPREMRQYRVGNMQVFHMEAQDDSKPIVLYIHGGAYYHNFEKLHWSAMAEWTEATGCGIVVPNYPLLYCYTARDAHPLMMQLYQQLIKQYPARRIIMGDSAGGGFTLPEGAKFFAIRHTAQDIFGLMLDDVTYERSASAPVGYNVYVDGELVGSTPNTAYDMPATGLSNGEHTFAVTAVYEGGKESAPATAVIDLTSGIDEIALDGQPVDVYTLDGRLVRRQATSLDGLKGLYLIGNKKVYVK